MNTIKEHYNYARDGFMYLLSYATLLIFSISTNFLLKAIVDNYLPDAVESERFFNDDTTIIGFLAAVIIAFPVFLYVNLLANKMLGQKKMKANTGVRNWLIYLTLVVVILIIIWQIISLFVSYLNGVLVSRFLIHTLITLVIAICILAYQYWHLKFFDGKSKSLGTGFKIFEWSVIAIILASVITGFLIIDSPSVRRAKRLDQDRIESLAMIRSSIYNYYDPLNDSGYHQLPANLDELINDPRVYIERADLLDPETNKQFEYTVTGTSTYQLCATFEMEYTTESEAKTAVDLLPEKAGTLFYHPAGYYCFDLSVDKSLSPKAILE